jgi:hypothetical protein
VRRDHQTWFRTCHPLLRARVETGGRRWPKNPHEYSTLWVLCLAGMHAGEDSPETASHTNALRLSARPLFGVQAGAATGDPSSRYIREKGRKCRVVRIVSLGHAGRRQVPTGAGRHGNLPQGWRTTLGPNMLRSALALEHDPRAAVLAELGMRGVGVPNDAGERPDARRIAVVSHAKRPLAYLACRRSRDIMPILTNSPF